MDGILRRASILAKNRHAYSWERLKGRLRTERRVFPTDPRRHQVIARSGIVGCTRTNTIDVDVLVGTVTRVALSFPNQLRYVLQKVGRGGEHACKANVEYSPANSSETPALSRMSFSVFDPVTLKSS